MHKSIFTFLFSLFITGVHAQFIQVADPADVQSAIEKSNAEIKSIESEFTQYKYLDVLEDKIVSEGQFLFKSPDMMKWEYKTPYAYIILRKQDKMLISDEGKVKEYDINSNAVFGAINSMMVNLITGNFFESGEYNARFYENEVYYKVELMPRESQMKEYLNSIDLYFKRNGLLLEEIQMNELSGDYTKIVFSEKIRNAPISDTAFTLD